MKNFIKSLLIIALSIFFINSNALAAVTSAEEIEFEINKIEELNNTDFSSFYNSSELVGINRSSFNIQVSEYKLNNKSITDSLQSIVKSINAIEQSDEFTDSEKNSKINDLIQKANDELNKIGKSTASFISSLGGFMPTITQSRFKKAFINYYNELYINENEISL